MTSMVEYSKIHPSTYSGRTNRYGSSDVIFVGYVGMQPYPFTSNHDIEPVPKFNISLS